MTAVKFVYVVCIGERGEGHTPLIAFRSLNGAKQRVAEMLPGAPLERRAGTTWMATQNRVDEVWIERLPVIA